MTATIAVVDIVATDSVIAITVAVIVYGSRSVRRILQCAAVTLPTADTALSTCTCTSTSTCTSTCIGY